MLAFCTEHSTMYQQLLIAKTKYRSARQWFYALIRFGHNTILKICLQNNILLLW